MATKRGFIYILSNKSRSVLYIGVTSDLLQRIHQHRIGSGSSFTKRYNLRYPIYYEEYKSITKAIEREKQLKNWERTWKLDLIREVNPTLDDIWTDIIANNR